MFSAQPQALDVVLAHDLCDPFVIDPLAGGLSVIDLGGDRGPPLGVVHRVDGADLLGEFDVGGGGAGSPRDGSVDPSLVRRPSDIDDLA